MKLLPAPGALSRTIVLTVLLAMGTLLSLSLNALMLAGAGYIEAHTAQVSIMNHYYLTMPTPVPKQNNEQQVWEIRHDSN